MIRKCLECGREFKCSPTDKTATCGKECSSRRRSRLLKGRSISEETKEKIRRAGLSRNNPQLRLGTPAAQASPSGGRFETNSAAKTWTLIDPDGCRFVCTNLKKFVRDNARLFGIDPNDDTEVERISVGFRVIRSNMRKGRRRGTTYKGWRVIPGDDRSNYEKRKEFK